MTVCESIKALELAFLLTTLFYHASSFFWYLIGLYFLIHAVIAQIFNCTAKVVILIRMPTNAVNAISYKIQNQPKPLTTSQSRLC